jgi:hypothetical protein
MGDDDSKTFDVNIRTRADSAGAEKAKGDLAGVTAETEKLTAATEAQAAVAEQAGQSLGRVGTVTAQPAVDLEQYQTAAEKSEQAANAAQKEAVARRESLALQRELIEATKTEAAEEYLAGNDAKSAALLREVELRETSLQIQRATTMTEADATAQAAERLAAEQAITAAKEQQRATAIAARQEQAAADAEEAEALAAARAERVADEESQGPAIGRGGRLGTFLNSAGLGSLGITIGFASIIGLEAKRAIDAATESTRKQIEEQQKFNREQDKTIEGYEKISTVGEWEKAREAITEQIQLLKDRRELIENDGQRDDVDARISALGLREDALNQAAQKGIERAAAEEKTKQALKDQNEALADQLKAYDAIRETQKAQLELAIQLAEIGKDERIQQIDFAERHRTITHKQAADQRAAALAALAKEKFDKEQGADETEKASYRKQEATAQAAVNDLSAKKSEADKVLNTAQSKFADVDPNALGVDAANEALRKATKAREWEQSIIDRIKNFGTGKVPKETSDKLKQLEEDERQAQERVGQANEAASAAESNKAVQKEVDEAKQKADNATTLYNEAAERLKAASHLRAEKEPPINQRESNRQTLYAKQNEAAGQTADFAGRDAGDKDKIEALEHRIDAATKKLEVLQEEQRKAEQAARAGTHGRGESAGAEERAGAAFDPKMEALAEEIARDQFEKQGIGRTPDGDQKAAFEAELQKIRETYSKKQSSPEQQGTDLANRISGEIDDDPVMLARAGQALENVKRSPTDLGFKEKLAPILKELLDHTSNSDAKLKAALDKDLEELRREIAQAKTWIVENRGP